MNIVIGMPILDKVEAQTVISLVNLLFYSQKRQLHLSPSEGTTVVHEARNNVISQAYNTEFDAIMFIDSDVVFPGDMLEQFINHDKDIMGVLCVGKATSQQNVFEYDSLADEYKRLDLPLGGGLVEVDAVGASILYIKRKVLDKIYQHRGPDYFFYEMGVGEDVSFCKLAKELGFKIYVDTNINVGHIGKEIRRVNSDG